MFNEITDFEINDVSPLKTGMCVMTIYIMSFVHDSSANGNVKIFLQDIIILKLSLQNYYILKKCFLSTTCVVI